MTDDPKHAIFEHDEHGRLPACCVLDCVFALATRWFDHPIATRKSLRATKAAHCRYYASMTTTRTPAAARCQIIPPRIVQFPKIGLNLEFAMSATLYQPARNVCIVRKQRRRTLHRRPLGRRVRRRPARKAPSSISRSNFSIRTRMNRSTTTAFYSLVENNFEKDTPIVVGDGEW